MEAQQADAEDRANKSRIRLSAEEATVVREKEKLRLARESVLRQMETSSNPRHRSVLEKALKNLDEKLKLMGE